MMHDVYNRIKQSCMLTESTSELKLEPSCFIRANCGGKVREARRNGEL